MKLVAAVCLAAILGLALPASAEPRCWYNGFDWVCQPIYGWHPREDEWWRERHRRHEWWQERDHERERYEWCRYHRC